MNVTRITQLFSVQGGVSVAQNSTPDSIESGQQSPSQSDAVSLSENSDPDARAAKVASIKAAVGEGSYNYNRNGVATAVYRDLL